MTKHPLDALFLEIKSRKGGDPTKSYTAKLMRGGRARIAKKLGEEAAEVIIAALVESKENFIGECADVLYHLLVLMAVREVKPDDVYDALIRRRSQSLISFDSTSIANSLRSPWRSPQPTRSPADEPATP
jgi:phosphoribosyl-ATP pyrophosphohydrolase